jgi:hypothetical protein
MMRRTVAVEDVEGVDDHCRAGGGCGFEGGDAVVRWRFVWLGTVV